MITKDQLQYLGAVRTPTHVFARGGYPASIDFARREYVLGTRDFRVGRVMMVRPKPPVGVLRPHNGKQILKADSVPIAPLLNGAPIDPSNNTWRELNTTNNAADGAFAEVLVLGDWALIAGSIYYDAGGTQDVSFMVCEWPLPIDKPPIRTTWKSIKNLGEGWAAGPMTIIPERYREALKGNVLFGQPGGLPIISRQSFGPCAISAYAADFVKFDDVPATLLLGYHVNELAEYGKVANDWWNNATTYTALTFVGEWLLFIGSHGYGAPCYGTGAECGDPTGEAKGTHAYPYRVQALAYHVDGLIDVAAGRRKYNDLRPSFWLPLDLPYFENDRYDGLPAGAQPRLEVTGAEFDSEACELHVCTHMQDSQGYDPGPLWHVVKVNGIAPTSNPILRLAFSVPTPPPPPNEAPLPDPTPELEQLRRDILTLTQEKHDLSALLDEAKGLLTIEQRQHAETMKRLEATRQTLRTLRDTLKQIQDWA